MEKIPLHCPDEGAMINSGILTMSGKTVSSQTPIWRGPRMITNRDSGTNVVEARISKLRDKIDKGFPELLINTVRGLGYIIK